jgi:hypothetical protein
MYIRRHPRCRSNPRRRACTAQRLTAEGPNLSGPRPPRPGQGPPCAKPARERARIGTVGGRVGERRCRCAGCRGLSLCGGARRARDSLTHPNARPRGVGPARGAGRAGWGLATCLAPDVPEHAAATVDGEGNGERGSDEALLPHVRRDGDGPASRATFTHCEREAPPPERMQRVLAPPSRGSLRCSGDFQEAQTLQEVFGLCTPSRRSKKDYEAPDLGDVRDDQQQRLDAPLRPHRAHLCR